MPSSPSQRSRPPSSPSSRSPSVPSEPLSAGALILRFLLELGGLVAVGYAGTRLAPGQSGLVLGLAAVVAVGGLWWLFVAPKAPRRLADPWRLLLELGVFGVAVLGLAVAGQPALAAGFGLLVVVDEALLSRRGLR
ncbi:MAG: YrdB family protein [Haloferacaceae archaeon]